MSNDSTESTRRVAIESTDAWARGDFDTVMNFYDADAKLFVMCDPDNPTVGREDIRKGFDAGSKVLSVSNVEYVSVTCDEKRAITEIKVSATYSGEGAPPEGAPIDLLICSVLDIRDGKIVEERAYLEKIDVQIQSQLGG